MPVFNLRFGNTKKYKLGIALGGGGTRGIAHLGVLQALKEKGIEPDIYAGVSAGAIAGAFLASGRCPKDVFEIMKSKKMNDFAGLHIPKRGLLTLSGLQDALQTIIEPDNLEDLPIPLIVGVTNMNMAQMEYFSEGPIDKLVLASASIPVIFEPVEYIGSIYCDGGLFENIPFSPLKNLCRKTISVSISPVDRTSELKNLIQVAARVFQLSVEATSLDAEKESDLFIEPLKLAEYDILDNSHADEVYNIGYEFTKALDIRI